MASVEVTCSERRLDRRRGMKLAGSALDTETAPATQIWSAATCQATTCSDSDTRRVSHPAAGTHRPPNVHTHPWYPRHASIMNSGNDRQCSFFLFLFLSFISVQARLYRAIFLLHSINLVPVFHSVNLIPVFPALSHLPLTSSVNCS